MDNLKLTNSVKKILLNFPYLLAIYLFGSVGTEYETKNSDLDLAVLSLKPLDKIKLWHVAQEVASEINGDVDIIDLKEASTVLQHQILTTGKRLYCIEEDKCNMIENNYLSMYLRLNEERNDLINDVRKANHG